MPTFALHRMLSFSSVYLCLQNFMLSSRGRRLLLAEHLRPHRGMRVLDLGCGPAPWLRFMDGVHYVGIDINPRYIAAAKLAHQGCDAQFFVHSIAEPLPVAEASFDLVMLMGVLHHLSNAEALRALGLAARALKAGGRMVASDCCLVPGQNRVARWLIENDRGEYVRNPAGYRNLARDLFQEAKVTVRHDLLRLPYSHAILECVR